MRLKSLLSLSLLAGAAMQVSAIVPLEFGPSAQNMEFARDEAGNPLLNEDGSLTITTGAGGAGGVFFTTKTLKEECPGEYTIFAFDYKANAAVDDIVLFHNTKLGNYTMSPVIEQGGKISVDGDWQTCTIALNRDSWGKADTYKSSFFAISSNSDVAKTPGFEIKVKDMRLLTPAERDEMLGKAGVPVSVGNVFYGALKDFDPDENATVCVLATGQVMFWDASAPLPAKNTTLRFEYKTTAPVTLQAQLAQGVPLGGAAAQVVNLDSSDWAQAEFEFGGDIAKVNWGKKPQPMSEFLWMTVNKAPADTYLYLKNIRFVDPNYVATDLENTVAERAADMRVFNLMGVEVKGDLAPGLYIQNGKKFIVR